MIRKKIISFPARYNVLAGVLFFVDMWQKPSFLKIVFIFFKNLLTNGGRCGKIYYVITLPR